MEALKQKSGYLEVRDPVSPLSDKAQREDTGDVNKKSRTEETILLINKIEVHSKLLEENNKRMEELKSALENQKSQTGTLSYAEVASIRSGGVMSERRNTLHSVVVASKDETETGEEVLEKSVKTATINSIRNNNERPIM
ncbi:hypothetical protein PYW08_016953 [Mythimna loreyi]|nr:hypothetical protein PYW08_016953 [Mythimna loreyi]